MTTDKARKRAVRTRMQKTGERYAAARRHIAPATALIDPVLETPESERVVPMDAPETGDPGWPETFILNGTGIGWAEWFARLDGWGAMERSHTEIARWLVETQGITGWWAQTVTVGYERARGRRAMHQTARGFEVAVSKTIRATADEVWAAITDPERRASWVAAGILEPGRLRPGIMARFAEVGGPAVIELVLVPRAPDRTTVVATARKLADRQDVERQRAAWRTRLAALAAGLATTDRVARTAPRSS